MFNVLEKIAQVDSKYQDVLLLENYAAFQNRYVSFIEVWEVLEFAVYSWKGDPYNGPGL
jgi:hypothetical protein